MLRKFLRRRQKRLHLQRMRAEALAPGAHVSASVQVLGWNRVRIGIKSVIGDDGWLNVNDRRPDSPAIVIGNFAFIGRRNIFNAGLEIRIGDYCMTGADCHFNGSDHAISNPFAPYYAEASTADKSIHVGPNCWFGSSVIILKGVAIGHGSIIGAGSIVTKSLPPFSMSIGSPARVIRRYDPLAKEWVDSLTPEAEKALPDEEAYLAQLKRDFPAPRLPVIAADSSLGDL